MTPLNLPTPTTDRDRTVSRRSEPSSRAAFMGEQPNPWDLLQPQDATSRHRGAKPCRRCDALQLLAAQTIPLSLSRQWRLMEVVDLVVIDQNFHPSRLREVVTGEACNDCKQPSLGIAHYCGFHRYEPLCTARSLERGATIDSWARSACYPRGSFYPLSDGLSIQSRRITMPDFRPCSACGPHSQAPLRHYTPKPDFHPG